mgnify:CR=1 FL=1
MILAPKNWEKFQHYKDRCPPWIKLHRDLLNDRAFMSLPTASKALAPLMWMLASESKSHTGEFDGSTEELEFRLRISAKDIELGRKSLIDKGFFFVASVVLADCQQHAIPEGEREGEGERETDSRKKPATSVAPPEGVSPKTWADFQSHRKAKRAPITDTVMAGIIREATKAGWTLDNALIEICSRGWTGFNSGWVAGKPAQVVNIMRGVI